VIKVVICVVVFTLLIDRTILADPSPTPTPDKSQYTLFDPTPRDLWRPYNTDRPSKTDSPYTIDAGVFQVESECGTGRSITKMAFALVRGSLATRISRSA